MKRLIFALLLCITALAAQAQITGQVLDASDGYPVPYASISYKGKGVAVSSDGEGRFTIDRHEGWVLTFSCLGYDRQTMKVTASTNNLTIKLKTSSRSLDEVVVKGKRKRYIRKDNPAVALMRRVIAAKKLTDLENHDFYEYMKYQKLTTAVNNIDTTKQKKAKWYNSQLEKSDYNGKLTLPVTIDETIIKHLYRKNPRKERDIIMAQQSKGVNKVIQTGDIVNTLLKEVFTDVNIYDDHIRLLQYPFPSPIGSTAISFYHFYIQDTVQVSGDSCYHLHFYPANQQDFGFTGDLYVLKDSTLHVKECTLNIPHKSDVNFVKSMRIEQEFKKLDNGEWVLYRDDMWAEVTPLEVLPNLLVTRNTRLTDYAFTPPEKKEMRGKASVVEDPNARIHNDDYWSAARKVKLTNSEADMDDFVHRMQQTKGFGWLLTGIKVFAENFIETSKPGHRSKFDIGPVNTTVSSNFVDGTRFRLSGRTMAALNPHFFWKGYGAYGTKTKNWYYGSEFTYSINKKENSPFEFPMRNIVFETEKDVMSPSDKYLLNNKDNIFMSFRAYDVKQMYFYNRQKLSFVYETDWGLSFKSSIKTESNEVAGDLHFLPVDGSKEIFKFRTTELSATIGYCPGQTFINTKQRRWPVNFDHPEVTLQHTMGIKGLLGGDYKLNLTQLRLYKRQWMGSWGKIDMHLNAGAEWNKVPFPLLVMPPVNVTYIYDDASETFSLMRNMEFLNDRYIYWSASWDLNGKIFNRLPLIHKLKWREYLCIKGMWGHLTDKNNPLVNSSDPMLMKMPEGSYIMTNQPYWEMVAGIHNIFKMFGVDFIHRLTYTNNKDIDKWGVRVSLQLTF